MRARQTPRGRCLSVHHRARFRIRTL